MCAESLMPIGTPLPDLVEVKGEKLTVLEKPFPLDPDIGHQLAIGRIDQVRDRVETRCCFDRSKVNADEVGGLARNQGPDAMIQSQCPGTPKGCHRKRFGSR